MLFCVLCNDVQTLSTAIIGSAAQITAMRQQYEAQIQELQEKYDLKVTWHEYAARMPLNRGMTLHCNAPIGE